MPRCPIFGMHMHAKRMIRKQRIDRFNQAPEMRMQRRDVEISQRSGEMKFTLYDRGDYTLIEGVTQFKYLGSTLEETYSYCLVVHHKSESRKRFGRVW